MKKLLICGATGFIGHNLTDYFAQKYKIYGIYHNRFPHNTHNINWIQADLTNRIDVERSLEGMGIVIQSAAYTTCSKEAVSKPYLFVTDNAVMNALILEASFKHNIEHLIFLSCSVMYRSNFLPQEETDFDFHALTTYNPYFGPALTKVYIEKLCEFYATLGRTKYTAIRHSNIIGPYDKFDLKKGHVFAATMKKVIDAKNGQRIKVWGNGEESKDFLYVSDLINAIHLVIKKQKDPFKLYNIGSGLPTTITELVKKIITYSKKKLTIVYSKNKPSIRTEIYLDSTKARKELGWKQKISLDEGIKQTWDWCNLETACDCVGEKRSRK